MHDSLTGLPNRSAFERALSKMIEQARREHREHALRFIDLDRFKAVNDNAGHAAGDSLLKQVGEAIRRGCRTQDFAARIGGDEFALLLADCSLAGAKLATQKIVDSIAGMPFTWQKRTYEIGASVGITPITQRSPRAAALMVEADIACYAAKSSGRNRVSIYDGQSLLEGLHSVKLTSAYDAVDGSPRCGQLELVNELELRSGLPNARAPAAAFVIKLPSVGSQKVRHLCRSPSLADIGMSEDPVNSASHP